MNNPNNHFFGNTQDQFRGFDSQCHSRFGDKWRKNSWFRKFNSAFGYRPPVNIAEQDTSYILTLFAAGLQKADFRITLDGTLLKISVETPQKDSSNYVYQELENNSFSRAFQVSDKVLADQISAEYADGVLTVTLPKNPDAHQPAQEINVS